MSFDPNSTALASGGIFGLDFMAENSRLVLLPVPWDVTTSYGKGTSLGPESILKASHQVDLLLPGLGEIYKPGIFMEEVSRDWKKENDRLRVMAEFVHDELATKGRLSAEGSEMVSRVNQGTSRLMDSVYENSKKHLEAGRFVGIMGGDHSTPLGLLRALGEKGDFGILHLDAHADLRVSYQGFTHSHASIMHNAMELTQGPRRLVQVGIRDLCPQEAKRIHEDPRINCFYDHDLKRRLLRGQNWDDLCDEILSDLPPRVYVSFDVDGLSPLYCPGTGTPVPGGLSYSEAIYLFEKLVDSHREIIGFDLVEVAPSPGPGEWDANVGARLVYSLAGFLFKSQGL